ncbi:spore germination protein GerPA/GerPF [Tumebacillus sp. BK434]|uniref:spore germination protein n=1 Tax=Tumebacillus sp. BK434 TaxID=2512169 RepID=UPI001045685C|nr:spore germination protein [Tumebacillus sp. BK434]TCP53379.1 spore germination protein GerPA/GerPF [Tumebacillus sp. BK434]
MPIGGINVFAFKVNVIDKGYINIGPSFVQDWNGYSKQNYGSGEANGDVAAQFAGATNILDTDLADQNINRTSAV